MKIITMSLIYLMLCMVIFIAPLSYAGDVLISVGSNNGSPGSKNIAIPIILDNAADKVKGVQFEICEQPDYLSISGCDTVGRASSSWCLSNELVNGCARILLYTAGEMITEGAGQIMTIYCDVSEEASRQCINLSPSKVIVSDENNDRLNAESEAGKFCITSIPCPSKAIYGEYAEQTELLRHFRDNILSNNQEGRELIRLYYYCSPAIVKAMEDDEEFKQEIKGIIDSILPMIEEVVE